MWWMKKRAMKEKKAIFFDASVSDGAGTSRGPGSKRIKGGCGVELRACRSSKSLHPNTQAPLC